MSDPFSVKVSRKSTVSDRRARLMIGVFCFLAGWLLHWAFTI